MPVPVTVPDRDCPLCPRLAAHRRALRAEFPDYHNAPVEAFGDDAPRLLIVGLAPGLHGANASGRPFTGDFAGILLYRSLYEAGFASAPASRSAGDGLALEGARITNAVKCLPPANKPTTREADTCRRFLEREIESLPASTVVLALGAIAHRSVVRSAGGTQSDYRFAHGAVHRLPGGRRLVDSYHCSRYNTQTGRLTPEMFSAALATARSLALT
ncbi:MAG TPA: uracil-DNA glycosylase [Gammaproteobacteria bacterium]|nr:uracil-DNA glycosylase [Gammaproteobacteria bacterium]